MEIITALIYSLIAGLSTCISIVFTYLKPKNLNKFLTLSLSFASGVMLLISIKELIPLPAINIINTYKLPQNILILLIMPLIAIIIVYISKRNINNNNNLYKVGILNMISLLLHNIPEGIATFISSLTNKTLGIKITLAIMAHNIPEGICIGVPIYFSTHNRKKAFLYTFISGIAEPIGALLTLIFLKNYINTNILNIVLYFIGSLMIIIASREIIPEVLSYKHRFIMLLGFSLSLFILLL